MRSLAAISLAVLLGCNSLGGDSFDTLRRDLRLLPARIDAWVSEFRAFGGDGALDSQAVDGDPARLQF